MSVSPIVSSKTSSATKGNCQTGAVGCGGGCGYVNVLTIGLGTGEGVAESLNGGAGATLILGLIVVDVIHDAVTPGLTRTVALVRSAGINDKLLLAKKNDFP